MSSQRWVTTDYRVTADGGLTHKRWLNPDNSLKTGLDLKREKLRVELEVMARRFVALTKEMPASHEPICNFCGLPARLGGGAINEVAGHRQTFCCGQPLETCCDGAPTG